MHMRRTKDPGIIKRNYKFDKMNAVKPACCKCKARDLLERKNILLQEINHRVKNNLQMLSSMLSLELKVIKDDISIDKISDCITRIKTMALLHEKLCSSDNFEKIEFNDFIHSLIIDLYQTFNMNYDRVKFGILTDKIYLDPDSAIPCGMIINEAITNSFKYAFPDNREGEILISLMGGDHYKLQIKDNGIGFSENADAGISEGFGMNIIRSLVKQLRGELAVKGESGMLIDISFPRQFH